MSERTFTFLQDTIAALLITIVLLSVHHFNQPEDLGCITDTECEATL